jgi:transcription antitermination factor NusG
MNPACVGPKWYVVQSNSHQERLAKCSLDAVGVETYLPMMARTNKDGRTYGAPFFPSYLFAHLTRDTRAWSSVFSARGVKCVLGSGAQLWTMPEREIRRIRDQEVDGLIQVGVSEPTRAFQPGQTVYLTKGYKGVRIEATFIEQIDKRRCQILLTFLGDSSRIAEAELAHLE